MIITEDAIIDYLICPLRYCFLWHYNVEPLEPLRTTNQRLRAVVQTFYKLMYEGQLCYRTVREALHEARGSTVLPEGPLWVYAQRISEYKVLAYKLPTRVSLSQSEVIGAFDGLRMNKDSRTELVRVNTWPRYTHRDALDSILGTLRTGLPQEIRTSKILEASLVHGIMKEHATVPVPRGIVWIEAVVRAIERMAFYPRKHISICRSCGFSSVCDPQWCSSTSLLYEYSKDRIEEDLQNARVPS